MPLRSNPLTPEDTRRLCFSCLNDAQRQKFEEHHELDLSFGVKGLCRFRVNLFVQRGTVAGAFRMIPTELPKFEQLGLPKVIGELTRRTRGLVLVTGPRHQDETSGSSSELSDNFWKP